MSGHDRYLFYVKGFLKMPNETSTPHGEYWDVKEAAVQLDTTVEYVRQLLSGKKPKLHKTKKGNRTLIDPSHPTNQVYIAKRRETIAA
jgi:hypothetical protein